MTSARPGGPLGRGYFAVMDLAPKRTLPRWFSAGLPLLILGASMAIGWVSCSRWARGRDPFLTAREWRALVEGEGSLIELSTVVLLIAALIPCLAALMSVRPGQRLLTVWLAVYAMGIVYFAGEEAS